MDKTAYVESLIKHHRKCCKQDHIHNLWSDWAYTIAFFCYHTDMDFEEAKRRIEIVVMKRASV